MICPNCNETTWENVDKFRMKQTELRDDPNNPGEKTEVPVGMSICTSCGFVSYPSKWKSEEDIKKHYRTEYRNPPTTNNIYAGQRKNHFHHKFLESLFEEWQDKKIESPKICEIGAAFGIMLQWLRGIVPKAELYGTELTTSFRRNAYYEFGLNLTEDIDETKKYDLIISYKVLEHQIDPDKCLEKYRKCLAPGGLFYVSVPTWFNTLSNFGAAGFDLEYYYDTNHINVWTRKIFEGMIARAGFEIVKQDHVMYNDTYLLKVNESLIGTAPLKENVEDIKAKMLSIKNAYIAHGENRYDDALTLWPDFPTAHVAHAEFSRKKLVEMGWDWFKENIINRMIKDCPNAPESYVLASDYAMRAKKFEEAIRYCERSLMMKPENPLALNIMINTMREMGLKAKTEKERLHYYAQAREVARHLRNVSHQHFREATDMIYIFNSLIPYKGEVTGSFVAGTEDVKVKLDQPEKTLSLDASL